MRAEDSKRTEEHKPEGDRLEQSFKNHSKAPPGVSFAFEAPGDGWHRGAA